MRGLTVRQPWATTIVQLGKDVENRTRNIAGTYRGPVAIHAGFAPTGRRGSRTTFDGVGEVEHDASGLLLRSEHLAWPYRLPVGVIIGVVDLVDVHPADGLGGCAEVGLDEEYASTLTYCSLWAEPHGHHLVLENARPLAHVIPYVGRLGLWTVPDDVEEQIRGELA